MRVIPLSILAFLSVLWFALVLFTLPGKSLDFSEPRTLSYCIMFAWVVFLWNWPVWISLLYGLKKHRSMFVFLAVCLFFLLLFSIKKEYQMNQKIMDWIHWNQKAEKAIFLSDGVETSQTAVTIAENLFGESHYKTGVSLKWLSLALLYQKKENSSEYRTIDNRIGTIFNQNHVPTPYEDAELKKQRKILFKIKP